jgi:predicted flap endonuclease-1-like 5' DNA nuclease/cell division protein FtsL
LKFVKQSGVAIMFDQSPMQGPGGGSLTSHSLEILLLLAAAFILGWLLRHWLDRSARIQLKLEAEQKHRRQLEDDFDRLRAEHSAMGSRISVLEGDLTASRSEAADKSLASTDAKKDASDLQARFDALRVQFDSHERSNSDLGTQNQRLGEQLQACGEAQAGLRAEVARLQALLDARDAEVVLPQAATQLSEVSPSLQLSSDDLKIIEGVGPKIAQLLQAAGIFSFAQLAKTDADRLREILLAAGERYRIHDPTTWPEQADLCAKGEWEQLKVLQDRLNAGRN